MTFFSELYISLIIDTLSLLPLIFQPAFTKKVQIDNARDSNPNNNNIAVTTTLI